MLFIPHLKLDLQLTTLEFEGLDDTLRYYADRFVYQDKADLTEDDLVLGYYYLRSLRPIIDRQTWQKRERRRTSSFSRVYKPYSFLLDLHLVRVLFRVLKTSTYPLSNERQVLLYKLHKVLANASALPNHPFPDRIPTINDQSRDLFSPHKSLLADGISNT